MSANRNQFSARRYWRAFFRCNPALPSFIAYWFIWCVRLFALFWIVALILRLRHDVLVALIGGILAATVMFAWKITANARTSYYKSHPRK